MFAHWNDFDRNLVAFETMRRNLDRLFAEPGRGELEPFAADLFETETDYVLRAEVPGVPADRIEINLQNGTLALTAERNTRHEALAGYKLQRQERTSARFSQSFNLPSDIDAERTSARLENGVLTVTVAKARALAPRTIAITTA